MNITKDISPNAVKPQFYDNAAAKAQYLADGTDDFQQRTKNRPVSQLNPEQYMLLWHDRLKREAEAIRKICECYVMVHRRYRAMTLSDSYGYWGTRPETQGRWINYDADEDGEVHPINIVRPDIKANVASLLQIKPAVQISATNKNAKKAENATRLQAMIDFFERDCWTEADRNLLFDGIHKEGTWLIENYAENGEKQTVTAPMAKQSYAAVYKCDSCGSVGKKELPPEMGEQSESEAYSEMQCPECGGQATGMVKSLDNVESTEQELQTKEIKHRMWSAFNFLIDRRNARLGGISTAKYLRIHEVASRADLETECPQFKFDAPFEFCYPLKCQLALACNDWSQLYTSWSPQQESTEFDEFEKLTLCLSEDAYKNYISPIDWDFKGSDGQIKFSIKRGQTISEAQERLFKQNQKGFRFVVVNDRVIDVLTPDDAVLDFRQAFTDVHFTRDSASFLSVPHWDSIDLQDEITNFNTIKADGAAANSKQSVWYNSEVFAVEDFGDYYIPSKDGFVDPDFDINKAIGSIPNAKSSDQVTEHLNFLMAIRQQVSSVTPALRGEAQPNQPYAAQRQQLDQSFGILAPAAKSYVQMYLTSMKQKVTMAFKCWTLEQFQQVASAFGEEWNDEIVAELVKTDLDRDVSFGYAAGTEQPQGQLAKELKFFNGLQQLMPFIQAGLVKPEIMQQIIKKIDEFGGFDFDLSGLETSDALAQSRYERIVEACKEGAEVSRQKLEQLKEIVVSVTQDVDPATGQPIQTPITAFDVMMEALNDQADIFTSEFEDIGAQAIFFTERIVEEMAKTKPNFVLLALLEAFVKGLQQQGQALQQEAMQNDPQMQAQQQALEDAKAADDQDRAEDAQAKQAEAEQQMMQNVMDKSVESAGEQDTREFEREKLEREAEQKQLDREHQLALAEKSAEKQTKEKKQ